MLPTGGSSRSTSAARRFHRAVLGARFRAAPHYRLVPFSQLTADERLRLEEVGQHPRVGGALRRVGDAAGSLRVIDRDTARLLSALAVPRCLPEYVLQRLGPEAAPRVAGLVLDGVLEIERGGQFLSGLAAHAVFNRPSRRRIGRGRVARLSSAALAHAAALPGCDTNALAARLYRFNTIPASPDWCRRLSTAASLHAFLRCDALGSAAVELRYGGAAEPQGGWLLWHPARAARLRLAAPTYKLYVSPDTEYLPEALRAAMDLLGGDVGAFSLKVGGDLYGVLRPDKLVVYFRSAADLRAGVRRLQAALGGMAAQGVPFTAAATSDGLLSWGLDPPERQRASGWPHEISWRSWLTQRLASFLAAASAEGAPPPRACRFAVDRVSLDGVDSVTWTPRASVWADAPPRAR